MKYLKVLNPIDREVKTGFKGEYYTIGAGKTESFPEDLAKRFVEVYGFLELSEEKEVTIKEVKEEVEKVEKEVKESKKK
jgi:hypothetical protein